MCSDWLKLEAMQLQFLQKFGHRSHHTILITMAPSFVTIGHSAAIFKQIQREDIDAEDSNDDSDNSVSGHTPNFLASWESPLRKDPQPSSLAGPNPTATAPPLTFCKMPSGRDMDEWDDAMIEFSLLESAKDNYQAFHGCSSPVSLELLQATSAGIQGWAFATQISDITMSQETATNSAAAHALVSNTAHIAKEEKDSSKRWSTGTKQIRQRHSIQIQSGPPILQNQRVIRIARDRKKKTSSCCDAF